MKKLAVCVLCFAMLLEVAGCEAPVRRFGSDSRAISIEKDGDFHEINDDNMLHLQGYYTDNRNYITLQFGPGSDISAEDFERLVARAENREVFMGANFSGIAYQSDLFHKYATIYYGSYGNKSFIKRGYFFIPTSDDEAETGYYFDINGVWDDNPYISFHQQTEIQDHGYYIDYRYDEIIEYYYESDDTWTSEERLDQVTDNMPME